MIWTPLERSSVITWIEGFHDDPPPGAYELEDPERIAGTFPPEELASSRLIARVDPISGAADLDFSTADADDSDIQGVSLFLARQLDNFEPLREAFEWIDLDEEERGSPEHVPKYPVSDFWLKVDGLRPVGSGGRVTHYRNRRFVEIVARRRRRTIGGRWRSPAIVAQAALELMGGQEVPSARLRGAYGYFEASKYERQDLLRPVFVFVHDRPARGEGPRWRVTWVEAATEIEGYSPSAGIESATGCV